MSDMAVFQNMSWMHQPLSPTQDVNTLAPAYNYLLHITFLPYFLTRQYNDFMLRVWTALAYPPFYSNFSSPDSV